MTVDHTEQLMTVRFGKPAGRPLTMNSRPHWSVRARVTKLWRGTAHAHALAQLGRAPSERRREPCFVRVSFPVPDPNRRRDPHNLAPTVKAIVDGLVDAGVWPDDNEQWVTILDPRFHHVPKGTWGDVIVTLSPRAGALPE